MAQSLLIYTSVRDLEVRPMSVKDTLTTMQPAAWLSLIFLLITAGIICTINMSRGLIPWLSQIIFCSLTWLAAIAADMDLRHPLVSAVFGMQWSLIAFSASQIIIDNMLCDTLRANFGDLPYHAFINHVLIIPYTYCLKNHIDWASSKSETPLALKEKHQ